MKNIFEVDSNEIKRILSLHEESTKKQYLNVISEQTGQSVTLPKDYELKCSNFRDNTFLGRGTQFNKTSDPKLLKTAKISVTQRGGDKRFDDTITYNCETGKFTMTTKKLEFNSEDLETTILKPFCGNKTKTNNVTPQNIGDKTKTNNVTPQNIGQTTNSVTVPEYLLTNQNQPDGGHNIRIPKNTIFKKSTIKDIIITGKIHYGNTYGIIEYQCVTGKFKVQGNSDLYNSENLEWKYLKPFCESLNQPLKTKTDDTSKKTQTNTNTNAKKQVYAQKTTNTTKEIQTSLGNTAPTGQITDTDLDQLIAQLNK